MMKKNKTQSTAQKTKKMSNMAHTKNRGKPRYSRMVSRSCLI